VEQAEDFPCECRHLLESYGKVFQLDELCRAEGLSELARLRRHQQESAQVMEQMKERMEAQLADKRVEPNSGLGEAIRHMSWRMRLRSIPPNGATSNR
jgi:transposase